MANNENGSSEEDNQTGDTAEAIRRKKLDESESGDDEETKEEGLHGYESEREPGEKVRVARSTRGGDSPADEGAAGGASTDEGRADEDDAEDGEESSGGQTQVTVRGEGTTVAETDESADTGGQQAEQASGDAGQAEGTDGSDASTSGAQESSGDAGGDAGGSRQQVDAPEPNDFEPEMEMDEVAGEGEDVSATTEDFAAMFEEGGAGAMPEQRTYSPGDRVEGEILEIGDRELFVEIDPQTTGIAKCREFETDEGELELSVGDTEEFYVTYTTEDEVYLGDQMSGDEGSVEAIREAYEGGVPVEGNVTGTNKGGFEVDVHGVDAFCPISEIELGYTEEKELHDGETYRFKVTEFEEGGDTIVVSRAELLRAEQAEKAKEALDKLEEGDVVEGVVTRTTGFGAFVDLGGVEGLIHISAMSHRHFDQPSDVVDEGERVEVEIEDIERPEGEDPDPTDARISLDRQATETDPWAKVNEEFAVGDQVEGEVVRNAPFGAFIEIAPGVEGLCHVSEMSWTEHVKTPDDVVDPGDKVLVEVQDINIADRQIGLSMRDAEGDPWDQVRADYQVGSIVEGTVENIEDFGVFIQLPTGITALMPRSEMSLPSGATPFRVFNQGDSVEARVMNINEAEREMALTPLDGEESDEASDEDSEGDDEVTKTPSSDEVSDTGGFGTLGDMIGDQLQDDEG